MENSVLWATSVYPDYNELVIRKWIHRIFFAADLNAGEVKFTYRFLIRRGCARDRSGILLVASGLPDDTKRYSG
jgi:hypothetical protein